MKRQASNTAFEVIVTEKSRRATYNEKFHIKTVDCMYSLTPSIPQDNFSVIDVINGIKRALLQLTQSSLEHVAMNDKLMMVLRHKDLDKPISVPMVRRSDFTPELLCERIMQVAQSKKELLFRGLLTLNVISTSLPRGGGGNNGKRSKDSVIDFTKWCKRSQSVIRIQTNGNDCLARAICVSRAKVDGLEGNEWKYLKENVGHRLDKMSDQLIRQAGVNIAENGSNYDDITKFQEILKPAYQLIVVTPEGGKHLYFRGPQADKQLFVILHDNHFDSLTSIQAFLKVDFWCTYCCQGFILRGEHRCLFTCSQCFGSGKCVEENPQTCRKCKRMFVSSECFKRHKDETFVCGRYFYCVKCKKELVKNTKHKCGKYFCRTCSIYVPYGEHRCFMQPLDIFKLQEEDEEPRVHLFYDIESMLLDRSSSQIDHQPNLVIAKTCCSYCWNRLSEYPLPAGCELCMQQKKIFYGYSAVRDFSEWLFGEYEYLLQANSKQMGIKQVIDCIVFAHNARSYDSIFVLNYLLSSRRKPTVIKKGHKIITMRIGRYKFLDSIAFLPMPLRNFADTFGLRSGKGTFPYLMNKPEYQDYVGIWPDESFYAPEDMKSKEQEAFRTWYQEQREKKFNFKDELIAYCDQDVQLLMQGVQKFRALLIETTGLDPFTRNITLSSFVMSVFRASYLSPQTLGIPPIIGYEPKRQRSHIATLWLDWIEQSQNIVIDREVYLGQYYADGYHAETRRIYEFFGCYFHGCFRCFPTKRSVTINNISGLSMAQLGAGVKHKLEYYAANGWNVTAIYECELRDQLKANPVMHGHFTKKTNLVRKPIEVREAYYGGRVETIKFLATSEPGEKILYYDLNSLYPYILKSRPFPKGHPHIIYEHFRNIAQYNGVIKAKIIPPRRLFHPLLPIHVNNKLMYTLCMKCAEICNTQLCDHCDNDRALEGTWIIAEVQKAVTLGYKIQEIFCIWHYSELATVGDDKNIYADFINKWMKIKLQASGWPRPYMTNEEKQDYIDTIRDEEGIILEEDQVCKRKDLRTTGKLGANSFYGKMAEKAHRSQTKFIDQPYEYFELLENTSVEIEDLMFVNDETLQLTYSVRNEFGHTPPHAAVIQACYVTSYARLHLYSFLESLRERVYYMDTDSVIFSYKPGDSLPSTGMLLGQMSDEIQDDYGSGAYVKRFCSIGCKSYCLEIDDGTAQSKYINKFKGITCSFATSHLVNFSSIEDIIYDNTQNYQVPQKRFKIHDNFNITTEAFNKILRFTFDKRRVTNDFKTEPFGF